MKLITKGKWWIFVVWDHFFGRVSAQSSRREASTQSFFDRLDIFSIICDAIETLDSLKITLEPLYKNEKQIRSAGLGGYPPQPSLVTAARYPFKGGVSLEVNDSPGYPVPGHSKPEHAY